MSPKHIYGISLEVDFGSRNLLPFDTSVIKPFCHKAAGVEKYDILRSEVEGSWLLCRQGYTVPGGVSEVPVLQRKSSSFPKEKASDDYYCVIVKLPTVKDVDVFNDQMRYHLFHSELRFGPVYLLHKAEYMNNASITSVPWRGYRVLPSCYHCLELLNEDATGLFNPSCELSVSGECKCNFSQCSLCKVWNPHEKPNADFLCRACKEPANLVCIICGSFFCGSLQAQEGHAFDHYCTAYHAYVFEINTGMICDYLEKSFVEERVLQSCSLQDLALPTPESSLQRNLEARNREVVTAELAVHGNISPEAKEDVLRNIDIAKTEMTKIPASPEYNSVSASERKLGYEEDIVVLKEEDDDAQRKAQEQNKILAVATAFKREYYHYLPQLVDCDKKIAYWKDLEIELARVEKEKLVQKIDMLKEESQELQKKLEELKNSKS